MKKQWRKWSFLALLFIPGMQSVGRDAPVTTIAQVRACPSKGVVIPVTVNGFTSIGAVTLRIEYDPTKVTYSGFVPNSALSGMKVNSVLINPNLAKIMIAWSNVIPKTLAANDTLMKINMNYINGTTAFTFNNSSGGGGDCEYADEQGDPLNDLPTETYFKNGSVQTILSQLNLIDINILNHESFSYKATQTITTVEIGSFFTVQSGGNAYFMAGQHIRFYPGTTFHSGAYMHARITDPCTLP